ncbi:HTH-type transcriptional repressor KstR2 [Peptococcaceae bacterium CEB3]|nr:HTH-type transcriptional repressor KstR2 [Peptococcaceae bacterium CEB3]
MRISKDPEERRTEILEAAEELFKSQGYINTTVDSIIKKVGVAKGTFYYYFKSKEDILDALVQVAADQLYEEYRKIAEDPAIGVMDKVRCMLRGQDRLPEKESELMQNLHRPENRELHERINIEIILKISPIFAKIIEQGKQESLFQVENALETVQFLLAGSQFLLESGLFEWSQEERLKRMSAMQTLIERSLGAAPGSFSFM